MWVADDDPIFRLILVMTIKKLNSDYVIKEHENGDEVYSTIVDSIKNPAQFPKCLFIDINMPGMNGWKCLDKMKTLLSDYSGTLPKIYIISSSIDPKDKLKALSDSLTSGYLTKPISIETLRKILSN